MPNSNSKDHNALIAAAARAKLKPIGCSQKGRSRTWLDDHGWWIGVIEFQPSSWTKGTFLNVGACWLWSGNDYLSFDDGDRIEPFHEFKSTEQFEGEVEGVAQRARDEVEKLRQRFATIESTAAYLRDKPIRESNVWGHFHAAVSAGLVGRMDEAKLRFEAALRADGRDIDWVRNLKASCTQLGEAVESLPEFRSRVSALVAQKRVALKLPVTGLPLFASSSPA